MPMSRLNYSGVTCKTGNALRMLKPRRPMKDVWIPPMQAHNERCKLTTKNIVYQKLKKTTISHTLQHSSRTFANNHFK